MIRLALLLSLALPAPLAAQTPPAQITPSAAEQRFTVTVEGAGPDVILIPGLGSPRAVWDGTRAALKGRYRLHLIELKGFGGGDPGPNLSGPILPALVEQLNAYIVANRLKAPAVVGHSLGGLTALLLAKAHPESVGKVMVVDALPWIGTIFAPPGATLAQVEPFVAQQRAAFAARYGQPADKAASAANAARLALTPAAQAQVAAWSDAADPRVVGQALYEDFMTDLRGDLGAIKTPITIVYPYSPAVPRERADALYRGEYAKAPKISFVAVEGAYHFVMLDQPEVFAKALVDFLAAP
ncbi:MAG: alpha/beta hydrolase [Sphingomonas sp.]|uniref:alpha/beta fold hydrolase n=1 Tax=Sphingomonas sp. TaxID=28214 RepID=UPI0025EC2C0A|nr:alpha/beta hydrolase [Sphingomonas sp.]MBX9882670.1 alpha/beta hydrolase [Sphingomonas sp.]